MKRNGSSLFSFLAGATGGTVLALLFAKNKGKEVRKRLETEKKEGNSLFKVLFEELGALSNEVAKASKGFLASDEVQTAVGEGKKKIEEVYQQAKKEGGKVMKEAQDQLMEYSHVAKEKAQELGEEMKRRGHLALEEFRSEEETEEEDEKQPFRKPRRIEDKEHKHHKK